MPVSPRYAPVGGPAEHDRRGGSVFDSPRNMDIDAFDRRSDGGAGRYGDENGARRKDTNGGTGEDESWAQLKVS